MHQRLIDLDRVEGKRIEIRQRRVTGAKIIERQASARRDQLAQHFAGLLWVFHHQRFGQLKTQRPLWQHRAADDVTYLVDQVLAKQLPAGNIDADVQRRIGTWQLLVPALRLGNRHLQDLRTELDDKIGFFRQRHEIDWIEQPQPRMVPPHQRLKARDLLGAQIDDRLVKQPQLLLFDRLA